MSMRPSSFDLLLVLSLALSACIYGRGARLLWRGGEIQHASALWQAAAFAAAWIFLAVALIGPLPSLSEHLFTAHMIQHEILMAAAAPLIALSRPVDTMLAALPKVARTPLLGAFDATWILIFWKWLARPANATILHGIAIWIWHAPRLFDAAVENPILHHVQHLFFFTTALLFWWSLFRRARESFGAGALEVALTMVHTSVLGALIALSPHVLYVAQTRDSAAFGLSPMDDQQLGGLIMWVPAGTIYAGIALALLGLWIRCGSGKSSASYAE